MKINQKRLWNKLSRELKSGSTKLELIRYLSGLRDAKGISMEDFEHYSGIVNRYKPTEF